MNSIALRGILTAADDVPPLVYLLIIAGVLLLGAGMYFALRARKEQAPPHATDLPAEGRVAEAAPAEQATTQATPEPPPAEPPAPLPAAAEAGAPAPAAAAPEPVAGAAAAAAGEPVVSIVPDPQTGELAIIVGGQRYESLLEVPEEQRPQVVRAVDNLIEFGLKTPAGSATGPAVPRTPSTAPRLETGTRTITPRPATPDEYEEARRRHERIKRISSVAGSLIPSPQEPATPAFFDALNAIIARRIEEDEELRGRRVVMCTTPEGDLQVVDGAQVFPAVDEVADDAVRTIIKAAIAEFEQQS